VEGIRVGVEARSPKVEPVFIVISDRGTEVVASASHARGERLDLCRRPSAEDQIPGQVNVMRPARDEGGFPPVGCVIGSMGHGDRPALFGSDRSGTLNPSVCMHRAK
jgi:hypothetical protein